MPHESVEIEVCADCLMLIANGDVPEDRPELADDMDARWPYADGWHVSPACPEDCDGEFSWRSCEGCGSALGGDRHPAVAYRTVP